MSLRPLRSEKGFALLVTLMVTALLVAVIVEFVYRSYISTARTENFSGSQRAALLAANGVEVARGAMKRLLRGSPHIRMEGGELDFSRTEGDYTVTIRVEDELARLSTGVVYPSTGVEVGAAWEPLARLVDRLGLDPNLLDTLADWIDSDDEPRSYGAESTDYYMGLRAPYTSANAMPGSTEELMMIKGFTPPVFKLLKPYVTVYNRNRRVNINTASRPVLLSLSADMTEQMADDIIGHRLLEPFRAPSDIMALPGFETVGIELQGRITVLSDTYRIVSRASAGESIREVEAVVRIGGEVLYWRHR